MEPGLGNSAGVDAEFLLSSKLSGLPDFSSSSPFLSLMTPFLSFFFPCPALSRLRVPLPRVTRLETRGEVGLNDSLDGNEMQNKTQQINKIDTSIIGNKRDGLLIDYLRFLGERVQAVGGQTRGSTNPRSER